MKRYVSRFLKTTALLWIGFPIVYPIALGIFFDVPADQFLRMMISPLFIFVTGLSILSGYGLWEMKRWAWYVFFIAHFFLVYSNLVFGWDHGTSHHKGVAFTLFTLFQVLLFLKISREIRVPYFFPRIRWWEADPRYRLSVPVTLVRIGGHTVDGEILDISMGGCFVKIRADLLQDELISLKFQLFDQALHCDGFIVWKTQSTVTHPRGIGVKFTALGKKELKILKNAIRHLRMTELKRRKARLSNDSAA